MSLPQPQPAPEPVRQQWRNPLPYWITANVLYETLPASARIVLQAIADKADRADAAGSLRHAFGGQGLLDLAGVSRSTFFRQLRVLELAGFVVCTAIGYRQAGRDLGNVYAIPGARGALDHSKASRRLQRMLHVGGGIYKPQKFVPHQTPELFGTVQADSDGKPAIAVIPSIVDKVSDKRGEPASAVNPQSHFDTSASVKLTLPPVSERHYPPCQSDTPPLPTPYPTHSPSHPLPAAGRGGIAARWCGGGQGGGAESKASGGGERSVEQRMAHLAAWLDRNCWRSETPPSRRAAVLMRDPGHALRCWEEFSRKAAEIRKGGGSVRCAAALFDRIFTGQLQEETKP